jgi:hypothetical protein
MGRAGGGGSGLVRLPDEENAVSGCVQGWVGLGTYVWDIIVLRDFAIDADAAEGTQAGYFKLDGRYL